MNHADHVRLLRPGIPDVGGVWADLGAGTGAFTLALAEIIGEHGTIYAVDQDRRALDTLKRAMSAQFPGVRLHTRTADFTHSLDFDGMALDGIVMANSLHFLRDKTPALTRVHNALRSGGRLLIVEYNTDSGNTWVLYPMHYSTWEQIARANGFTETQQIGRVPSRFLGEMYSAVSMKPVSIDAAGSRR